MRSCAPGAYLECSWVNVRYRFFLDTLLVPMRVYTRTSAHKTPQSTHSWQQQGPPMHARPSNLRCTTEDLLSRQSKAYTRPLAVGNYHDAKAGCDDLNDT